MYLIRKTRKEKMRDGDKVRERMFWNANNTLSTKRVIASETTLF